MFTVMTLNLYRVNDWEERKPNIIKLIREQQPDIIAFQEVVTNLAFADVPLSSVLANECDYTYRVFAPTLVRNDAKDRDGNRTQRASEGQAFISRYPIVATESYFLQQHVKYPDDVSVLFCSADIGESIIDICNVHFANNDIAYKHLDELLLLIAKRQQNTVILGDFNIFDLAKYKTVNTQIQSYTLSSEIQTYVSYPADNDTLDYVVVPSKNFTIHEVLCPDDYYVSDHRPVIASISRKHV